MVLQRSRWSHSAVWAVILGCCAGIAGQEPEPAARPKTVPVPRVAPAVDTQAAAKRVRTRLLARTDVTAEKTPLKDLLLLIARQHDIPIWVDEPALAKAGVALDTRMTLSLKNLSAAGALRKILKDIGLCYVVDEDVVVVTTAVVEQRSARAAWEQVADVRAARLKILAPAPGRGVLRENAGGVRFAARAVDLEQQLTRQIRPSLRAELHVIRMLCQPRPEQMRAIQEAGDRLLASAAKAKRGISDPREMIREGLAAALREHLSPAQVQLYQAELAEQARIRREVQIRGIVARLDEELVFSESQRVKLGEALSSAWNANWDSSADVLLFRNDTVPEIPDEIVTPVLTAAQAVIWSQLPKQAARGRTRLGFLEMELPEVELSEVESSKVKEQQQAPQPDAPKAQAAP